MTKHIHYLTRLFFACVVCSCFNYITFGSDADVAPSAYPPPPPPSPPILRDAQSLQLVVNLMKTIKDDDTYHSYYDMLDDVKAEHTIRYHKPNAPYFYTNDRQVLKDIVTLVMRNPNGIIDDTKNGNLKVYRDFDYHEELEDVFGEEPLYRRELKESKQFQEDYLGQTATGPTNRVIIALKIKSDDQNASTFEKRIVYTGNNIDFVDAYPSKGLPPKPKPKVDASKNQQSSSTSGKSQQKKETSRGCGCN